LKWKVPIAGLLWPKVAVSDGLDLKSSYRALRSYLNSNSKGKAIGHSGGSINGTAAYAMAVGKIAANSYQKQITSYTAALQDTVHEWRFIITRRGYVGIVPNLAKVGDVITIMKGGRVPFVLRTRKERPEAFRLVGECYVHNMMNGEGLSLRGVVERGFRLH